MAFVNRWYQQEAHKAGFSKKNSILALPTGSGKSVVCASIVSAIDHDVLVLQPSLEILKTNFLKACARGIDAAIYSASAKQRHVGRVTYATIGSIIGDLRFFRNVETLIIDECHLVNAKGGMYEQLIKELAPKRLIGMTATPYRQHSTSWGTNMRLLNRTRPKLFNEIGYVVNPGQLLQEGFLLAAEIHQGKPNTSMLRANTTGAEFTERSKEEFAKANKMGQRVVDVATAAGKNHYLVFVESIAQSVELVAALNKAGVKAAEINAKTHARDREYRLAAFEGGDFKAMVNVGTLTTGYDFPALDCIIDASSTMSAALHYQKMGRIYRPFEKKSDIYDLAGNIKRLGDPLLYRMLKNPMGQYEVYSDQGRVTGRIMQPFPECETEINFGRHNSKKLRDLPQDYLEYMEAKLQKDWKQIFFSEIVRRRIAAENRSTAGVAV